MSGSNQFIRIVLDSREEFETACEKLLAAWRSEQGEGEPGLYTRGMYAFIWNSGETFPYEYQDEFENLYLLYGYQALRPIKVNRVRLSDLDGKSGQEALEMLKAKSLELPEIYAKKGNEAQVVSMVLAELRQDPELLKTRAWTYTDPTLYEAAERIADCIYP